MFDEAYEGTIALIKHLEEAADRLKHAGARMEGRADEADHPTRTARWTGGGAPTSIQLGNRSITVVVHSISWANPYVTRSAEEPNRLR
jgi:hypothetical protein